MPGNHKIYCTGTPIGSIATLAKTLDISEASLLAIAGSIPSYYTVFKKTVKTKERLLCDPRPELKVIQKRIISRILRNACFPHYLHGGIKAEIPRDFVSNSSSHSKAELAITLDIKNFFPSITTKQIARVFSYLFKFPPNVSGLLTELTTLDGSVPQGAATSAYMANLVMWEKEYRLAAKMESKGLIYTRLIDDMVIPPEISRI